MSKLLPGAAGSIGGAVLVFAATLLPAAQLGVHASRMPVEAGKGGMQVIVHEAARRVDVTFDGQPFTAYVWPESLTKPVLYPLIAPGGITVSRGYPLEPRSGERVDHPHHAGMWFNYGNVNGFDFWNNSTAIQPAEREKMGSVRLLHVISARSGSDRGELVVESVWTTGKGQDLLKETTRLSFVRREGANVIDRVTTLKALERAVFHDDKEGLLGMRVAHFLESPGEKGGTFADASGRATQVAAADTAGASGVYLTSEGKSGAAAWGTRGRWCLLSGTTPARGTPGAAPEIPAGRPVTIAIYDHPGNPGYPTSWHARGYGLFAANPLGDSVFDPRAPKHELTLEKGESATFRYRVIFYSRAVTAAEANAESDAYAKELR